MSIDELLKKSMLKSHYEGGLLALSALETNMNKISNKIGGDNKFTIDEFIILISEFKCNYDKASKE